MVSMVTKDKENELNSFATIEVSKADGVCKEKGACSSTMLAFFQPSKTSFRDALCLRHGWQPHNLPTNCVFNEPFTVEHCFSCNYGGYPILKH